MRRHTEGITEMADKKIYFDMDNVLADFDKGIVELCGLPPRDMENPDPVIEDKMWNAIRKIEHFYDRLDLVPGAEALFRLLNEQYSGNCEILTGIPKAKRGIVTAGEDKIRWMRRMLSETIPVNIVYKEEKKNYCTGKHCILIDDYSRNIQEWEACGGTGILFKNASDTIVQLRRMGILFSNAAADSDSDEQP